MNTGPVRSSYRDVVAWQGSSSRPRVHGIHRESTDSACGACAADNGSIHCKRRHYLGVGRKFTRQLVRVQLITWMRSTSQSPFLLLPWTYRVESPYTFKSLVKSQ